MALSKLQNLFCNISWERILLQVLINVRNALTTLKQTVHEAVCIWVVGDNSAKNMFHVILRKSKMHQQPPNQVFPGNVGAVGEILLSRSLLLPASSSTVS